MDLHFRQHSPKQNRKRLTKDQATLLETSFTTNQNLQAERKLELARQLGLPPRQVAIWFQNRRARQKTHTTEIDYKTIQLELDIVLEDKRRLEKEVDILRYELNKAQHMLLLASKPSATPLPSISASGDDDHASSSSHGNMIYGWEDAGLLPVEELYACMNGPEGQLKK